MDPARQSDRIAKIIPRLASEHDGEVVASVKAIIRILEGSGSSLHELAGSINVQRRPAPRRKATADKSAIENARMIAAIERFQAGWEKIGSEAKKRGDLVEYHVARGAWSALRQVRKFLLDDPNPSGRSKTKGNIHQ